MPSDDPHDSHPTTVREQRAETTEAGIAGPTPSMPAIPEPMKRGGVRGAAIGALIGAVVLAPFAAISFSGLDFAVRLLIVLIAGAAAGSAAGFVFFGGAVSEVENPESHGDDDVVPDQFHR